MAIVVIFPLKVLSPPLFFLNLSYYFFRVILISLRLIFFLAHVFYLLVSNYILLLCRFRAGDGEVKYVREAEELIRPEKNTLLVSFTDLEGFNQELATTIQEEYYR